jgi:hypothetical protein
MVVRRAAHKFVASILISDESGVAKGSDELKNCTM